MENKILKLINDSCVCACAYVCVYRYIVYLDAVQVPSTDATSSPAVTTVATNGESAQPKPVLVTSTSTGIISL